MSNSSSAEAMPAPEAGSNPQPNAAASAAPTPRKRRVPAHPFALTKAQRGDVELTLHLCGEGLKPEYASRLAANTVPAAFFTTLKLDTELVQNTGLAAINATNAKEGCTADEATAKAALMENLRQIQSAARAAYGDTQPERVHNYLVGNVIDANRATLESSAQTIVGQASADRPGEINTEFITDTTDKRTGYVNTKAGQQSDLGTGKQQRLLRNQSMASIRARRKKVQRAADAAWPHTNPANAKARTVFRLPAKRPYSY